MLLFASCGMGTCDADSFESCGAGVDAKGKRAKVRTYGVWCIANGIGGLSAGSYWT